MYAELTGQSFQVAVERVPTLTTSLYPPVPANAAAHDQGGNAMRDSTAQVVSYPNVADDNDGVMVMNECAESGEKGKLMAVEQMADDHTTEDQPAAHREGGANTVRRVRSKAGEAAERRRGDSGAGAPEEQAAATGESAYTTLPREFLMDDFGDTNVNVGAEEDATLRDTAWITHIINEGQYHRLIIQVRGPGGLLRF